jgi:DNA-binding NarL/FixJ family response regulator
LNSMSRPFVAVTVIAESRKEAAALVRKVRATNIARVILFIRISSLSVIDEIRESPTRVVLVAVPTNDPQPAIEAISFLCLDTVTVHVIAVGHVLSPAPVVAALRAGARGFIEPTASPKELNDLIIQLLGTDDPDANRAQPPDPDPPDGSLPPTVSVRVPRPRAPRTLPSRAATPEPWPDPVAFHQL